MAPEVVMVLLVDSSGPPRSSQTARTRLVLYCKSPCAGLHDVEGRPAWHRRSNQPDIKVKNQEAFPREAFLRRDWLKAQLQSQSSRPCQRPPQESKFSAFSMFKAITLWPGVLLQGDRGDLACLQIIVEKILVRTPERRERPRRTATEPTAFE